MRKKEQHHPVLVICTSSIGRDDNREGHVLVKFRRFLANLRSGDTGACWLSPRCRNCGGIFSLDEQGSPVRLSNGRGVRR